MRRSNAAAAPLPWPLTTLRRPISVRGCSAIAAAMKRRPPPMNGCSNDRPIGPENAEYHLHRGHLLYRRRDMEAAAAAFAAAAALDPDNAAVRRAQMTLYFDHGRITEATALGGALLHSHPEDKEAAEAVLHL